MSDEFRQAYSRPRVRPADQPGYSASPFSVFTRNGIKSLMSLSLTLIGFGVLILIFPLILAVVVAALFFMIALGCLSFAWKLHRASKRISQVEPQVHVEITRPPDSES